MLIGELQSGQTLSSVLSKYNSLNSKFFPYSTAYLSDESGKPIDVNGNIIPVSHTTGEKKKGSSGIVILGLLAVGAFIFMNKKGKKK